jgi:Holliday junction DNA helicase RuvA
MIASLTGVVTAISALNIVVEVGGVGLSVRPSANALARARLGQVISLATYLVVREDELALFGFADERERYVFEALQRVSGVGPRLAMQAISALGASEIERAIGEQDPKALTAAPGIGAKVAQRIVLELAKAFVVTSFGSITEVSDGWASVQSALVSLGWGEREAREAIVMARKTFDSDASPTEDLGEQLKLALSFMGKR